MKETRSYPQSVFRALQQSPFENILDSNMFAVYISRELTIPRVQDPRRTQKPYDGISRHPSYVSSSYINQVFNYLGFIKRTQNSSYQQYLPVLFHELNHFLTVMEDIVYNLNIAAPVEVYEEQKKGLGFSPAPLRRAYVLELKQCWLFRFSPYYLLFLLLPSLIPFRFLPGRCAPVIEPFFQPR